MGFLLKVEEVLNHSTSRYRSLHAYLASRSSRIKKIPLKVHAHESSRTGTGNIYKFRSEEKQYYMEHYTEKKINP
jgi:hypothetical protein